MRAVLPLLPRPEAPVALLLCDAPYRNDFLSAMLAALPASGWLEPGAVLVLEHPARHPPEVPEGYGLITQRSYGRAGLTLLRLA